MINGQTIIFSTRWGRFGNFLGDKCFSHLDVVRAFFGGR